jgi:hypothetical protein
MGQSDNPIVEGLPAGLHRVIRKLSRKLSNGKTKEYEQSFHVKHASPGDRYAMRKNQRAEAPSASRVKSEDDEDQAPEEPADDGQSAVADQDLPVDADQAPEVAQDPNAGMEAAPPPLPARMSVKVLDLPWELGDEKDSDDPVPPQIRKLYDPKNRGGRVTNPLSMYVPANTVTAGDQMLWGVTEQEMVQRLRSGQMIKFSMAGSNSGCMLVKVEGSDGYIHKAYLEIEGLNDPFMYEVWGELYDADQKEGGFSRRAAATYELAKASGFDDIVPPTVLRHDEYGNLDAIMSDELVERRRHFGESIARGIGADPVQVKRHLNGYATVQFYPDGMHGIDGEKWFHELFETPEDGENDRLNHIFESMPPNRRMAILRAAVFDTMLWTGDRTWGSIGWGAGERHQIVLLNNQLSMPNPHGLAILRPKYGATYLDPPVEPDAFPLLWSEPVMMVATRGGDQELRDYEEIAVTAVRHLRDDRSPELVRALIEHQIPIIDIAATLARIGMLWTHHQQIARNPFLILDYFSELSGGEVTPLQAEFMEVEEYVNEVMSNATGSDFNFAAEMRGGDDPEQDEQEEAEAQGEEEQDAGDQ